MQGRSANYQGSTSHLFSSLTEGVLLGSAALFINSWTHFLGTCHYPRQAYPLQTTNASSFKLDNLQELFSKRDADLKLISHSLFLRWLRVFQQEISQTDETQ